MARELFAEELLAVDRALERLGRGESLVASWMAEHGVQWAIDTIYRLERRGDALAYRVVVQELGPEPDPTIISDTTVRLDEPTLREMATRDAGLRQLLGLPRRPESAGSAAEPG